MSFMFPEAAKNLVHTAKKARKQYLQIARSKKRTAKKVRKAIGQQLSYIKRNLKTIENLHERGNGMFFYTYLIEKLHCK